MNNMRIDRESFLSWATGRQEVFEFARDVEGVIRAFPQVVDRREKPFQLVVDALDRGEAVDLIDVKGAVFSQMELTKDGYVEKQV
jgi:hypothetical protein